MKKKATIKAHINDWSVLDDAATGKCKIRMRGGTLALLHLMAYMLAAVMQDIRNQVPDFDVNGVADDVAKLAKQLYKLKK